MRVLENHEPDPAWLVVLRAVARVPDIRKTEIVNRTGLDREVVNVAIQGLCDDQMVIPVVDLHGAPEDGMATYRVPMTVRRLTNEEFGS